MCSKKLSDCINPKYSNTNKVLNVWSPRARLRYLHAKCKPFYLSEQIQVLEKHHSIPHILKRQRLGKKIYQNFLLGYIDYFKWKIFPQILQVKHLQITDSPCYPFKKYMGRSFFSSCGFDCHDFSNIMESVQQLHLPIPSGPWDTFAHFPWTYVGSGSSGGLKPKWERLGLPSPCFEAQEPERCGKSDHE